MSVVVSVVNYLHARALNHRTFRAFLEEVNAEYKALELLNDLAQSVSVAL